MQNYKKQAKNLRKALDHWHIKEAQQILKELELILQQNIAADEARLENEEPLVCVETNEEIKRVIFHSLFEIHLKTQNSNDTSPIKIYLDDKRNTPDGYIRTFWPSQVIDLVETFKVDEISLDHDLGDDHIGTGYDVVLYFEEKVYFNKETHLPELKTHTDNSSARIKMRKGIEQIHRMKYC